MMNMILRWIPEILSKGIDNGRIGVTIEFVQRTKGMSAGPTRNI